MTSIFRSFLVASGIFAVFTAVQPALHAQGFGGAFSSFFAEDEDDDNSPVDVSANVADIYLEKNIITLLGNVIVEKKGNKITCDKMEIFLKEKTEESDDEEKEKKNLSVPPKDKLDTVLDYIREHPGCRTPELISNTPFSQTTMDRCLSELKRQGLIKHNGSKKYGGYSVVGQD